MRELFCHFPTLPGHSLPHPQSNLDALQLASRSSKLFPFSEQLIQLNPHFVKRYHTFCSITGFGKLPEITVYFLAIFQIGLAIFSTAVQISGPAFLFVRKAPFCIGPVWQIRKQGRIILPVKLIFKDKSWYLHAYCRMQEDYRLFKVNRIVMTVLDERFGELPDEIPPIEQACGAARADAASPAVFPRRRVSRL